MFDGVTAQLARQQVGAFAHVQQLYRCRPAGERFAASGVHLCRLCMCPGFVRPAFVDERGFTLHISWTLRKACAASRRWGSSEVRQPQHLVGLQHERLVAQDDVFAADQVAEAIVQPV